MIVVWYDLPRSGTNAFASFLEKKRTLRPLEIRFDSGMILVPGLKLGYSLINILIIASR
jgi:hypothetical protein